MISISVDYLKNRKLFLLCNTLAPSWSKSRLSRPGGKPEPSLVNLSPHIKSPQFQEIIYLCAAKIIC